MAKQKSFGVAFGSGGVRGLAHLGVMRVLLREGLVPTCVAGSSIGAWVAAHYALHQDLDELTAITLGKKREKLTTLLEPTLKGGLVRGNKLESFMQTVFQKATFNKAKMPVAVVATNLQTGAATIMQQGSIATAVRASMAVPSIFAPVKIEEQLFVDGGLVNPVPDDVVRAMGASVVVAVNLDALTVPPVSKANALTVTAVTRRSLDIMRHQLARYSLASADVVIEPSLATNGFQGWRRYFTEELGNELIAAGEREAELALPKLRALLS